MEGLICQRPYCTQAESHGRKGSALEGNTLQTMLKVRYLFSAICLQFAGCHMDEEP